MNPDWVLKHKHYLVLPQRALALILERAAMEAKAGADEAALDPSIGPVAFPGEFEVARRDPRRLLVLSALAPTDGMAAILLPPLPLERNKAPDRTPLHTGKIADLRPLGAKSDRTAKLYGACPVPASSGKTSRHRLNRGGHRQADATLHRVVVVRMRAHRPTIAYAKRRTAEGKTKREIIRCLKRFVAREIYGYLCPASRAASPMQITA